MDPKTAQILLGAAGAGGAGEPVYPEELFSIDLYDGTGSAQTITNGIDLSGEGGLVWVKCKSDNEHHVLADTERGANKHLVINTSTEQSATDRVTAFNSNGFSVGNNNETGNGSMDYCAWTFRKAPKFFDIVTYTGTGSATTVAHNLGSVPGMIIVKRTNATSSWYVYHRSLGATKELRLNSDNNANTSSIYWNDTEPTSSVFSVGTSAGVNASGDSYVAYIFAHNESEFGENLDEPMIHCGGYTGNGNKNGNKITLGFEPQWIIFKKHAGQYSLDWNIVDMARGMAENFSGNIKTNSDDAQSVTNDAGIRLLNDGFDFRTSNSTMNGTFDYVFMAIGRPTKEPSAASEVFDAVARTGTGDNSANTFTDVTCNIGPVDLAFVAQRTDDSENIFVTNKLGQRELESSTNAAQAMYISNDKNPFDVPGNKGIQVRGDDASTNRGGGSYTYIFHFFKRFRKFFDVVLYDGNGNSNTNISHGLGVAPELIFVKAFSTSNDWAVWHKDIGNGSNGAKSVRLNTTAGALDGGHFQNNGGATATQFGVHQYGLTNGSNTKYIAYLFASLAGISKVGSYTGTGSNINVDCGFSAGARFIVIKRADGGRWYLFDSERGIISGNDPHIFYDFADEEVTNTDSIDPLNSGFTVTSSAPSGMNQSGDTYLFFAIA